MIGGGIFLVGFAALLGVSVLFGVVFFALYLLVVVTYTRIRAEAGLPWLFGPDMTPHQLVTAVHGTGTMSMADMTGLTQFQWLDLDYRCTVMPHQLEAMKMAGEARMNQRHLCGVTLLATVLGNRGGMDRFAGLRLSVWGRNRACGRVAHVYGQFALALAFQLGQLAFKTGLAAIGRGGRGRGDNGTVDSSDAPGSLHGRSIRLGTRWPERLRCPGSGVPP